MNAKENWFLASGYQACSSRLLNIHRQCNLTIKDEVALNRVCLSVFCSKYVQKCFRDEKVFQSKLQVK